MIKFDWLAAGGASSRVSGFLSIISKFFAVSVPSAKSFSQWEARAGA